MVLKEPKVELPPPPPQIIVVNHNPAHLIEWNPKSVYADKFKIDNYRLSMRNDENVYQMVSLKPFPKNNKITVVFKVLKYGGEFEICLGILC